MSGPRRSERQILAWLAGAMEPGEAAELRARVRDDPGLAARVRDLEARISEGPPREPAWSVPPPGLWGGQRPFAVSVQASAFSAGPVRAGEAFRVRIQDPGPPERLVIVLLRGAEGWEVLAPADPDELLRLRELPPDGDGYALDLIAPEAAEPGRTRWAVALPEVDMVIDWSAPPARRWAALRAALEDGRVPVSAFETG